LEVIEMALPVRRGFWLFDPFEEMKRMKNEMDEMFEHLFEMTERESRGHEVALREVWRRPLIDLEDKGDKLVLTAEFPGVDKEDIKIEVEPFSVTISAEKKKGVEEKKKDYYYCERSYTGYKRSIALPTEINPDDVEAEYKNGVLTITMKKVQPVKKKEVKVK
jgi:HSP20 family protein